MFGARFLIANACLFALAGAPAQADPLPSCASDHWDAADCQIQSHDRLGLRFEKRHSGRTAEVRVLLPDGTAAQTIEQPTSESQFVGLILVLDLDGDGRDELLISTDSPGAHSNVPWALWRATGDSTHFALVAQPAPRVSLFGEPFGASFWHAGDDLFAAWGDGPMRSWLTRIFRIDNGQLVQVLAVQNDGVNPDGSSSACYLKEQNDLARYGLTPNSARDRFCTSTKEHVRYAL